MRRRCVDPPMVSESVMGRNHEKPARQLIKRNADSACLPPNDVTVLIAVLDIDDKIE